MEPSGKNYKIMGIFGTGRSGSSWLGSIMDSHPQVAYRFEPFHRAKQHHPPLYEMVQRLKSEQLQEADLSAVYEALLPAHPKLERPPFFPKDHALTWGKSWLRPLALRFNFLSPVFQKLYTARRRNPSLVFKEVNMERVMINLLARTSVPIIYLVRHPCAVVASNVRGQKQGVMFDKRHSILKKVLEKRDDELAERYRPQLEHLDGLEKEALLWRIDVEKSLSATQNHENALIIIYEKLCDDPHGVSKQAFQHFGLNFSEQTTHYLNSLTQTGPQRSRWFWGEFGLNPYFSVARNPAEMKEKWKQKMSSADRQRILTIVQDSPAFQFGARVGGWD